MKIKADDGDPSGKALAYSQAVFVIWRSQDGRTGWEKVKPEDVPEWVTHPAVLGRLVNGDMCMDPMLGERGSERCRECIVRLDGSNLRLPSTIPALRVRY